MIKRDEKQLLVCIYLQPLVPEEHRVPPRVVATQVKMCPQRAHFLFDKWAKKGWYDYGVNAGLGWLTPEGECVAGAWMLDGD